MSNLQIVVNKQCIGLPVCACRWGLVIVTPPCMQHLGLMRWRRVGIIVIIIGRRLGPPYVLGSRQDFEDRY